MGQAYPAGGQAPVTVGVAARLKDAVDLDAVCGDLLGVVHQVLAPAAALVWEGERGP